jgi:hypothetical protein
MAEGQPTKKELTGIEDSSFRSLQIALELKRQAMERFFARRQTEWRVSLGLWAAFAVVANAARDSTYDVPVWALTLVAGVFVVLHSWWVASYSGKKTEKNRDQGWTLENAIREQIGLPLVEEPPNPWLLTRLWPVAITALLAIGAVFVISG